LTGADAQWSKGKKKDKVKGSDCNSRDRKVKNTCFGANDLRCEQSWCHDNFCRVHITAWLV